MRNAAALKTLAAVLALGTAVLAQGVGFTRTDVTNTPDHLVLSVAPKSDLNETDFSVVDIDMDGDMDVIIGRKTPFTTGQAPLANILLINDGAGHLTDMTAQLTQFIADIDRCREVDIADMNNDGWPDVITFNTVNDATRIWPNLGNDAQGNWLGLGPATLVGGVSSATFNFCGGACLDYNLDGLIDLFRIDYSFGGNPSSHGNDLLEQNAANPGTFLDKTSTVLAAPGGQGIIASGFGARAQTIDPSTGGILDINGDGFVDVLTAESGSTEAAYSDGLGGWRSGQLIHTNATYDAAATDFDGDGDVDVFRVQDGLDTWAPTTGTNGDGTIILGPAQTVGNGSVSNGFGANPRVCDFDGDGDMDVFVSPVDIDIPNCTAGRFYILYENTGGSPRFVEWTVGGSNPLPAGVYDSAVADFDGDGILDILMSSCTSGFHYWVSDPNAQVDGFKSEFIPQPNGDKLFRVTNAPVNAGGYRTLYNLFDTDNSIPLGSGPFLGLSNEVIPQIGAGPPFAWTLQPNETTYQYTIPAFAVALVPVVRTRTICIDFGLGLVDLTEIIEEN